MKGTWRRFSRVFILFILFIPFVSIFILRWNFFWKQVNIFAKYFILHAWQRSEYNSICLQPKVIYRIRQFQNPVYPEKYGHFEDIFRNIIACSGIITHCWGIFGHVQAYLEPYVTHTHSKPWIIQSFALQNPGIFRTNAFFKNV